jgi:putative DNA primase/helicase
MRRSSYPAPSEDERGAAREYREDRDRRPRRPAPSLPDGWSTQEEPPSPPPREPAPVDVDKAEIGRLAALDPISYDRDRAREAAAESLKVRISTLDKLVTARREEAAAKKTVELCRDIEPWPEPVNVAEVLDEIRRTISRFIVCDPATATAATLWIAFTWTIEHVQVAPLAIISAPEKRCGKSTLLELIERLSRRSLSTSNISPAALFRVIEAQSPTLLIDEADAFLRENEELRGIINSGHTRPSAFVIRTVGEDFEVKQFSTWAAKAIAGIGKLADTIMDRAIVFALRRKLPHEKTERLRYAERGLFETLARKLARFEQDYGRSIGRARPDIPDALNDRAQDNWEPLLAIADLAGGHWPKEARRAALELSGEKPDDKSTAEELLADVRNIFDAEGVERIALAELLKKLIEDESAPWQTWNRGKPMTARQLGRRLSEFKATPQNN